MSNGRLMVLIFVFTFSWVLSEPGISGPTNKCIYPDGRVEFTDQLCSSGTDSPHVENKNDTKPVKQNSQLTGKLTISKLKGTWILNSEETENFVLRATLPSDVSKLEEWLRKDGNTLPLLAFEFDSDKATASFFGGNTIEFQVSSQQDSEIKYSLKNNTDLPAKTLAVSMLKDGNIKIVLSEAPEMSYLAWKRGSIKTGQVTQEDVKAASKIWRASLQNIVNFLQKPSGLRLATRKIDANILKGTWILDSEATEKFVLSGIPASNASKLAEWFGMAAGYFALCTYEFDGDIVTVSAFRGGGKLEFQVSSRQDSEIKYSLQNDRSLPAKTLAVSMLKDGNIVITHSEAPEMSYLVWKRGSLKPGQATQEDVMAASKIWLAALQNILNSLHKLPERTPEPSIPVEDEDPRPALEEGIRNGAIRKATSTDAQAWIDTYAEKYKRKNLMPPNMSSPLLEEVSKGNAYVVLKKFTYPPGLRNNNKAIFLIPRNVPDPDGDYGHSAIYLFYDDYWKGAAVEVSAGSSWAGSLW